MALAIDIKYPDWDVPTALRSKKRVNEAMDGLDKDVIVSKVTDYGQIKSWGVTSTPALVVDDQVAISGRVPTVAEFDTLLRAGS